jgi:DNA polymerase III delta prime subunit
MKVIRAFVDGFNRPPPAGHKSRILFFDEAHALTSEAADSLLKDVEEPATGVIFCFATTEPSLIRPALLTRLIDLEVKPLGNAAAIELLRRVATAEKTAYEPEALALLAGLQLGYPRDLLNGLQRVTNRAEGGPITRALVRDIFDVDYVQALVDYFVALADGDFARQTTALNNWSEPNAEKAKRVRAFLLALYYNNVLGKELIVDALVHSIQNERSEILHRFRSRVGAEQDRDLEFVWRKMLEFWRGADNDLDDDAAILRLTLFQQFVSEELPRLNFCRRPPKPPAQAPATAIETAAPKAEHVLDADVWEGNEPFFQPEHAKTIINRASFFVQEYGLLFNAAFELHPPRLGAKTDLDGRQLVAEFVADLEDHARLTAGVNKPIAHLTLLERDDEGLRALIAAYVPPPDSREAHERWRANLIDWSRSWHQEHRLYGEAIEIELLRSGANATAFHWKTTLSLCAGLADFDEAQDPAKGSSHSWIKHLGIPSNRRARGALRGGRLMASDLLTPDAIKQASANGMAPLFAFDDEAWDRLRNGWELDEFEDRRRLKKKRLEEIRKVEGMFGGDITRLKTELEKLKQSWPSDPKARLRTWSGWFDVD